MPGGRHDGGQILPHVVPWMMGSFYLGTWHPWRIQKSIQLNSPCGHIRQPARFNPHSPDFQDSLRNTHRSRRIPTAILPRFHRSVPPHTHNPRKPAKPTTRDPFTPTSVEHHTHSPGPPLDSHLGSRVAIRVYTTCTTCVTHTPPPPWVSIYSLTIEKLQAWD